MGKGYYSDNIEKKEISENEAGISVDKIDTDAMVTLATENKRNKVELTLHETLSLLTSYLLAKINTTKFKDVADVPCRICGKMSNADERIICVDCMQVEMPNIVEQIKSGKDKIIL